MTDKIPTLRVGYGVVDWNDNILENHPRLIKDTENPADSLLIAVAKVYGFVVVSDETDRQKANRKIPRVCDGINVVHKSGEEFLSIIGLMQ